jgi:hypothetical protein
VHGLGCLVANSGLTAVHVVGGGGARGLEQQRAVVAAALLIERWASNSEYLAGGETKLQSPSYKRGSGRDCEWTATSAGPKC